MGTFCALRLCPQGMLLALVLPIIEQCHCLTFNLCLYLIWASSTFVAVVGLCLVLINLSVQYYYLFPISRLPVSWKLLADHEMDTTGLTRYFIKTMAPPAQHQPNTRPDQTVYLFAKKRFYLSFVELRLGSGPLSCFPDVGQTTEK